MDKDQLKNNTPLISVIIPVFDCNDYLERCVNSIIEQTYTNIEILLIDDGSSDGSASLCDSFSFLDPRVRVFHIPHSGVAEARNAGLSHSTGELISFVDADDYASPTLFEALYTSLVSYDASIATCHHSSFTMVPTGSSDVHFYSATVIEPYDYCFTSSYSHNTVWGALYRREVVAGLRFDTDIKVGEDSVFFAQSLLNADKVVDLDAILYHYYVRPNSLSHKKYDRDSFTDLLARDIIIELFSKNSKRSRLSCYGKRAWIALRNYRKNCMDNGIDSDLTPALITYIRKDLLNTMRSSLPLRLKAYVLAFSFAPRTLMKVYLQFENNMRS